jgi:YHS domain-containing protein
MDTWVAGTRAVVAGELPPYVARVTLPESWRVKMSGHVVAQVTKVLAEAQDDPRRAYDEPAVWVYLVGVPDGSYGAMGKALTSTDLVRIITKSQGEAKAHGVPAPEPEPGTLIDPVCGMTVPLTEGALTLEVDGTTYAFCTKACREVFAEDHKVARP